MSAPLVQTEHRGAVSEIRLCRAEAHNALDAAMLQALDESIAEVAGRGATCVVIVSGQDRVFSAGADLQAVARQTLEEAQSYCALGTGVVDRLAGLPVPTIAAVSGPALGGGFELVMACDVAVAAGGALFGLPEVQLGAIPSFGGVRRLCRRLGPSAARELVYTGRTVSAARAKEMGLVLEVVKSTELAGYCEKLAERIARNAPLALAAAKRLFVADELGEQDAGEKARLELLEAQRLISTSDWREGLTARLRGRQPGFERK
jgi:enoyl-CoA hydratase/carnithine racemase